LGLRKAEAELRSRLVNYPNEEALPDELGSMLSSLA